MLVIRNLIAPLISSRTLCYVFMLALLVGLYAAIPTWLEYSRFQDRFDMPSQFHAALSLVLGWLLVFRTNTAYSRWWEARTHWGGLVNCCRNLAIKLLSCQRFTSREQHIAQQLIISFPIALRGHLRSQKEMPLLDAAIPFTREAEHIPQAIAHGLYQTVQAARRDGRIDGHEYQILDEELRQLMNICGACERILKTRIVRSYRVFARQCVLLFLATLPWGVAHDFRIWTIPLTIITAYFMIGLETVAEHVEEPFGYDEDDLDLDSLCETIAQTVSESFSVASQPAPQAHEVR